MTICGIQEPLKVLYSHTLKSDYSEKYAAKTNASARIRMGIYKVLPQNLDLSTDKSICI